MKKRIFFITQFEKNPITGEDLGFNEAIIKVALEHKAFVKWDYICHDKDVYLETDEIFDRERCEAAYKLLEETELETIKNKTMEQYIEANLRKKTAEIKPKHWHIVLYCKDAVELEDVARWFHVPSNMIDIPKGRGQSAFYDCVEYLVHESKSAVEQNKHHYEDEEVHSNHEWRTELTEYIARKLKYGHGLEDKDYVRMEVAYNGMTLNTVRTKYPEIWVQDMQTLKRLRLDYTYTQPKPLIRISCYISGEGRLGKGILAKALSRTLFPEIEEERDLIFETGAEGTTFEGYDGQPIIIWNDCRSFDLIKKLGGRENVFNVFDTHPTSQMQNIKYGSTSLCNCVNIVNSVQDYREFLDGLAGEYESKGVKYKAEDKRQSYERFPFIIPIDEHSITIMANMGYFNGVKEYDQYLIAAKIKCNLREIAIHCGTNLEKRKKIEANILAPVKQKFQEAIDIKSAYKTDDEIDEYMASTGYGEVEAVGNIIKRKASIDDLIDYFLLDTNKEKQEILYSIFKKVTDMLYWPQEGSPDLNISSLPNNPILTADEKIKIFTKAYDKLKEISGLKIAFTNLLDEAKGKYEMEQSKKNGTPIQGGEKLLIY